ncbi:hypothetical protein HAX54_043432 [Datura stramonium]|uniref:Uncharacterized protein n=1 Tax=Datura stramonium TaxID=4076 RepID=A0ABS8W383_DATST|nr:hypothetical protein [Datura stramonium]
MVLVSVVIAVKSATSPSRTRELRPAPTIRAMRSSIERWDGEIDWVNWGATRVVEEYGSFSAKGASTV